MRVWKRLGVGWRIFSDFWTAKDVVWAVVLWTGATALLGPVTLRLFMPLSFVDTLFVAALFGIAAFGLAYIFAPKHIHHIHDRLAAISGALRLTGGVVGLQILPPPLPLRAAAGVQPDWPIRELFLYLAPGITKDSKGQFSLVAHEVLDKLCTGALDCWGREIIFSRRTPLTKIDQNYWRHANLVDWLLDPGDAGKILQAQPVDHGSPSQQQYSDLQINRTQAIAIWQRRL